jgi:hypothetical protein
MLKLNGAWLCGLSSVPQGSGLSRLIITSHNWLTQLALWPDSVFLPGTLSDSLPPRGHALATGARDN